MAQILLNTKENTLTKPDLELEVLKYLLLYKNSEEVLKIVREAEEKPKEKKPRRRPRKHPIEELEEETEEEEPESSSSDLELELDECVARRTRSHREN
ncbi:hypothetical protein SS1G_09176 [Sclerotinia sclerotiorum 1980 UF-70]|uniref:Uncharacterized protein n=1 Tax=Sclerotinia sclerotiorum (strain ATCC 18683 / 1980 / Ss-1) TaxID=665079 RepID=A7EV18_SCLS1|nr:hypothetical protein SS1G_09176 [Sclerotinia sclerotiorum 1980 UF-70]EDN93310.1 hypothetical protein SS1G_09176 [Sclerotinia sclerotiorum 1980 UF-70]